MRFLISGRNTRWLLVFGVVLTAVVAGTRVADLLRLRKEVIASRDELEKGRLIAAVETPLTEATWLSYDDVGMAGEPLPSPILEKLKENYRLPHSEKNESDAKKKLLTTATVFQLRSTLGVDERTARFIAANANVSSWEELAQRRRQLFEENEDAIEPLIVARVSRYAAESGIEKIDQFKVEPPKTNLRRTRTLATRTSSVQRPSATPTTSKPSSIDLDAKLNAVRKELRGKNEDAFLKALDDLVNAALGDETLERTARAALEDLLNEERPVPVRAAPLQMAAIRLQPQGHFVMTHLVKAYATRVLKQFSGEGKEPVQYVEEPFPPLVSLSRPVQRRFLEALAKNGGSWFTEAQLKEILGADKTAPQKSMEPTTPEPFPLDDEKKLRAFHAQLIEVMWRVAQLTQVAKNAEPETYSATLLFKCPLEQLVNFIFKIENDVRWLRVVGLRIAVEQPDQPLLGVTVHLEASILKPSFQSGPKG